MSIIEIAEKLAKEKNVSVVEEIEIDMGELCTVEWKVSILPGSRR